MGTEWKEVKPGAWSAKIGPFTANISFRDGAYDACVCADGKDIDRGAGGPGSIPRCFMLVPSYYEVFCATSNDATRESSTKHVNHHYTLDEMKAECEKHARHLAKHVAIVADAWRSAQ